MLLYNSIILTSLEDLTGILPQKCLVNCKLNRKSSFFSKVTKHPVLTLTPASTIEKEPILY